MCLHYLRKQKAKIVYFHLNAACCFANRHTKDVHIITWPQMSHRSFAQESTVCTKQDLGKEYSMLLSVTTHSLFTTSVMMSVAVSKSECSLSTLKWKVNGQYWSSVKCSELDETRNNLIPLSLTWWFFFWYFHILYLTLTHFWLLDLLW